MTVMARRLRLESWQGGYTVGVPCDFPRQLPAVWTLTAPGPNGTAQDVEAICRGVVAELVRRGRVPAGFTDDDFDDTVRHLLGETCVLHAAYNPEKRRGTGSFEGYLYDRLRFRAIDYVRGFLYGRRGQHRPPPDDDGGAEPGRLLGALADPSGDWVDGLGGLQPARDRERAWAIRSVGVGTDHRPPIVDPGADPGADRGPVGAGAERRRAAPFVDCGCGWRSFRQAPNGMPGWHFPERCVGCGAALSVAA